MRKVILMAPVMAALAACGTDPVDPCFPSPCFNGGVCAASAESFTCTCPAGYSGVQCEVRAQACDVSPCLNGGTCLELERGYFCDCPPGLEGQHCELNVNDCAGSPCFNGGTCTDALNGFTCTCAPGYEGAQCEMNIDDCADSPCGNGGLCVDQVDGFACVCPPGYPQPTCACSGEQVTINFAQLPSSQQGALEVDGVVVTGSAPVSVLANSGLGIVGGLSDNMVDTTEWIRFDLPASTGITYLVPIATNTNSDGTTGDSVVKAWGPSGEALGTVAFFHSGTKNISAAFGQTLISGFSVHMQNSDALRIGRLTFTPCAP